MASSQRACSEPSQRVRKSIEAEHGQASLALAMASKGGFKPLCLRGRNPLVKKALLAMASLISLDKKSLIIKTIKAILSFLTKLSCNILERQR